MANRPFNRALGASSLTSQAKPPSRFKGVTARVFPLRANMYRLREFCDSYLGVAPEIARFRPALPYVFLMALDYGKMDSAFANFGWVSQREVAFAVPLEWYDAREDPENPRFVDFAVVCPFIYVDDEISLSTGRQVYGWPKVKVWANPEVNPWIHDPLSPQRLLSLSTMVYPELYSGKRQEPRTLLEVHGDPFRPFAGFPPQPDRPSNPLAMLPPVLAAYRDLFASFFEMLTRAPQLGYASASPLAPWLGLLRSGSWGLSALSRNPALNNITLKQFRDIHEPWRICYEALVNSQIQVGRYNAFGPLGDTNQLLGDPSGGFRVLVHRYQAQPVVDSLGIDVERRLALDGVAADVLRPVFPFWLDLDLEYGVGNHLCWRTKGSPWHCGNPGDPRARDVLFPSSDSGEIDDRFNTTLGGALQGVTGPFRFRNTTLRVCPLLADPERLKEFCEEYLDNDCFRFEAWGSYVYLVATNYADMSSKTDNIGWWADRDLTFLVPIKCRKGDQLVSLGLVPTFSFANTSTAAITASEIKGQPTTRAVLESPPNAWMSEAGPSEDKDQGLLSCRTQIMPALFLGQEAQLAELLKIHRSDSYLHGHWKTISDSWGATLLAEHRRLVKEKREHPELYQRAKALALELLVHEQPWNFISLKQFRDAHDPDDACYQSIVRTRRVVEHIDDLEEIEGVADRLHVHIHRQPSQPIVEILGLQVKWTAAGGETPVDVLQPLRPFWVRLGLREELGMHLCVRTAEDPWTPGLEHSKHEGDRGFFEETEDTHVGPDVLEQMLGTDPRQYEPNAPNHHRKNRQHLRTTAHEWLARAVEEGLSLWTRQEAAEALEKIEPQAVLEAVLSAEWENCGRPRWFRKLYRYEKIEIKPDLCLRCDSVGPKPEQNRLFEGEAARRAGGIARNGWYSEDDWPVDASEFEQAGR